MAGLLACIRIPMTKVTQISLDEDGVPNSRRIHLREISGETDAPLETIGQDLRAARQRRGDDLATVSRNLKIRKDHLEAIEEDRFDALPGRAYAVGFVRTYADYLGLNPAQCVERFKAEIADRGEAPRSMSVATDPEESKLPTGWIVIAVVVLALVGYGAYHFAMSTDSLARPPVASVPAPLLSPARAQTKIAGKAARPALPFTQPLRSSRPANAAPAGAPGATSQAAAKILASLPKGQVFGQRNINPRIVLRARSQTHVLVKNAAGNVFIDRTIQAGDSYQVPDKVGLTLSTPDGGAVGIELDGQAMGFAGPVGKTTESMSLDPQAVVDRFSGGHAE
ncbi:MAG: helix-turn-helix domain-containing protein [Rhizomicrobium sp.]